MPITETARWTPDPAALPALARRAAAEPSPEGTAPRFEVPDDPPPRRDAPERKAAAPPRPTSERARPERAERRDAAPAEAPPPEDTPPPRDEDAPADAAEERSAPDQTAAADKPTGKQPAGKPALKSSGAALKAKAAGELVAATASADPTVETPADALESAVATAVVPSASADVAPVDAPDPADAAAPTSDTSTNTAAPVAQLPVVPPPVVLAAVAAAPGGTTETAKDDAEPVRAVAVGGAGVGPRTAATKATPGVPLLASGATEATVSPQPAGPDPAPAAALAKTASSVPGKTGAGGEVAASPALESFKAALDAAATPAAPAQPAAAPLPPPAATLPDALTALAAATTHAAAPPTRADGAATPIHAVAVEIGLRALKGASEFSIRLDPEDLGRVEVKLKIGDNGQVSAALVADRVETVALLQREARTLERAFEQAGLKSNPDDLSFSLRRDDSQGGQPRQDTAPEPRSRTPLSDVEPAQRGETILRTLQSRRWATGVDISI